MIWVLRLVVRYGRSHRFKNIYGGITGLRGSGTYVKDNRPRGFQNIYKGLASLTDSRTYMDV